MEKSNYHWKFCKIGGVTRVRIDSGEDIAHLHELDQKMWTVLSCPVKGLEIDEKTLTFMDSDHDGKIRVNEVIEAAKWLTSVVKNPDLLLKMEDKIALSDINQETEDGLKIYNSAKQILKNLGLEKDEISIADTSDSVAIFAKTKFNGDGIITTQSTDDVELQAIIEACLKTIGGTADRCGLDGVTAEQIEAFYATCVDYSAWQAAVPELPYGENTEAALAAYNALKSKIDDYFMRCKLVAFNDESSKTLDVSVERMGAISDKNLAGCMNEIAEYPLARIGAKVVLPLGDGVNPAWEAQFAELKRFVFAVDFPKHKQLTEAEWLSIEAKFAPYVAWKSAKKGEIVESLGLEAINGFLAGEHKAALLQLVADDKALEAESLAIDSVDKLLHLYRDFYVLIKNFVTLSDFYARSEKRKAIFQAGTLYIDQRSCDLCLKVSDMGKQNTMAAASGMFLVYCDCFSKQKNATMQIVAVMTSGDVNNLMVGKNAIFYDNDGLDWDATVTKIIDNPISIGQAFWSPYRKIGKFVEGQINKFASEKDSKMTAEVTGKISESTTNLTAAETKLIESKTQAFDIAKFAGIFAALGMALGMIGSALVAVARGFMGLTWWQMPLVIVAILLLISGPSMIMAWLKLRKRDLAPVLNANGWAVNSNILVNILFGATLTKVAVFPKLNVKDPFVKQGIPAWRKALYIILLLGAACVALYFYRNYSLYVELVSKNVPNHEVVEVACDSTVVIEEVVTDSVAQQ